MSAPRSSRHPAGPRELRAAFTASDHDRDGRISFVEFEHLLANLDAGMSKQDLTIGFREVDTDHDGLIDAQEFIEWWRSD
jgi:Ca2+-binding EF-hand superfamily protein